MAQPAAEIAHVLFVDIVGYSRGTTSAQARLVAELTSAVNATEAYRHALEHDCVLPLPTGDGMALVFFHDVSLPARCACDLAGSLREADVSVRMGIHSGLVQRQRDISGNANVAGEGINTAQRVMDFGDGGHILLSEQYAQWLGQLDEWSPYVSLLGEGESKHNFALKVFTLHGPSFGRSELPAKLSRNPAPAANSLNVVILYKRKAQPDESLLETLEGHLKAAGHQVFIDRHLRIGVEWAKAIEERIRTADAVVVILSDAAIGSEMLEYEIETAAHEAGARGKPNILPVRVGSDAPIADPIGSFVNHLNFTVWMGPQDDRRVLAEVASSLTEPPKPAAAEMHLEPVGGAVPIDSPFYVERVTDGEFLAGLDAHESLLLIKAPRQYGKTSLIGRGSSRARQAGSRVALTDFQKLNQSQLGSDDTLYRVLAATLARQFKFDYDFAGEWLDVFGPNMNLDNFVRAMVDDSEEPLVWFMDEADRLFGAPTAGDFFGLIRSWHNARATEPLGPWNRLTIVIAYATEAHLFIKDLNQSPFNVGRQIPLPPFTVGQIADLNERYGSPIGKGADIDQLAELTGGQPFLVRRALDVLARGMDFAQLLETADREDGPFGDHLKRVLISVSQMPEVADALKESFSANRLSNEEGFYRLVAAGVIRKTPENKVVFSCDLYRRFLPGHLPHAV
jgi:class 3 adenylate cyclase